MPGVEVPRPERTTEKKTEQHELQSPTEINVDSLPGRVCYFSFFGDLAIQAYIDDKLSTYTKSRDKYLKKALVERLYFAVLMFDHVVIHCSDPLRNKIVLQILEEHFRWISEGRILFIFSRHIHNITDDYRKYIDGKIGEYTEGYCSDTEADSLSQPHMDDEYYKRVEHILAASPYFVRRTNNKQRYSFSKLCLNDLNSQFNSEQVIVDASVSSNQLFSLNLTLYQLIHIKKVSPGKNGALSVTDVFPTDAVKSVIDTLTSYLKQGNTIARTAIVDSLKKALRLPLSGIQQNVLKAVSLRMDMLYCNMNSGDQLILEFHPSYEQRSIYNYNCFLKYMEKIAQSNKIIWPDYNVISAILQSEELEDFRLCFITSMADMKEHMNLIQVEHHKYEETAENLFQDIIDKYNESRFSEIKNHLKGGQNR